MGELETPADKEGDGGVQPNTEARMSRKEKRKTMKKMKRKQTRKEIALKQHEEEEARLQDPQELINMEQEEAKRSESVRIIFEERERAWIEAMEIRKKKRIEEEERRISALEYEELSRKQQIKNANDDGDDDWEYVEEGPAEIIWQENEITVKKKRVKVPKRNKDQRSIKEDSDRPTSNPLPPQSEAFDDYKNASLSAQQLLETVAEQVPHFGTEQDKDHCPFHLKTGACRFGQHCSRVHFYPDKSSTLLIKNMYNGPGLTWEQDEGLEYIDEEIERCYEDFYEDVHTEFLKFGEIINFKVCINGAPHLRGNVYVQYSALESALVAHQSVNGRYFAGKQISCDFINVTRWKVAICGEYVKSRYKTCSRGRTCNFIHCFRNPGGEYEWADSDRPPPKYWVEKMVALFGYSDAYKKHMMEDNSGQLRNSSKKSMTDSQRYVTSDDVVQLRGKVACEISSADELTLTELMFNGVFKDRKVEEMVSLLLCFVWREKLKDATKPRKKLTCSSCNYKKLLGGWLKFSLSFFLVEIDIDSFVSSFRPDIMEATYAWAEGSKFYEIMSDFEGSLIRAIRRLEEVLQQLIHAANSIGEIDLLRRLFQKLRETLSLQLPYTCNFWLECFCHRF